MHYDNGNHSYLRRRLAELRRAGYCGPAYLHGRPAYEYLSTRRGGS